MLVSSNRPHSFDDLESHPLVSIVMPSLNQAGFIDQAIESVLSQSWRNLELIVADGGSEDGTLAILERWQAADARLKWFSEKDDGPANAVNKAIGRMGGILVGWLNSDDLYAPEAVRRAAEALLANPTWLMVYGQGRHIDAAGNAIGEYPTLPPATPVQQFANGCFICQPTVFFRRAMPVLLGTLDERLKTAFDFDYWVRAFKAFPGRIGFVDALLAFSRLHEGCITQSMRRVVAMEGMQVLVRHFGKAPPHWALTYIGESLASYSCSEAAITPPWDIEQAIRAMMQYLGEEDRQHLLNRISQDWRFRLAQCNLFIGVSPDCSAANELTIRHQGNEAGVLHLECENSQIADIPWRIEIHGSTGQLLSHASGPGRKFTLAISINSCEASEASVIVIKYHSDSLPKDDGTEGDLKRRIAYRVMAANWLPGKRVPGEFTDSYWVPGSNMLAPEWSQITFGCVMSLGNFCHPAMALKRANLRSFAGPFDWIFSNADVVAHCLSDDFSTFLNRSYYVEIPEKDRVVPEANACEHRYYREKFGLRFMFNHHTPTHDDDYAYLERCVTRFRQAMNAETPKLLLLFTVQPVSEKRYESLLNALRAYNTKFLLVVVRLTLSSDVSGDQNAFALRTICYSTDFLSLDFPFSERSNGVEFSKPENNDRLQRFLRSFKVDSSALIGRPSGGLSYVITRENFDEKHYLEVNPDVAIAVRNQFFPSGWHHYDQYGRAEGRWAKILDTETKREDI